ncbi:rRNA maturation RNase YbeY [Croceitalea rosinachiae]|uniref:Endoribonuclease YbeY n=1 Tax=Croceitalea rosinachiae TaxID=3075596 RepID=A0ABU3A7V8_9FLAO|nr:rRNA maturation RNase YbeY [Croceitalea sp. F388]MDT0606266.1 rRNA maturation RNase YbeY [Croceitalea sp. F388]
MKIEFHYETDFKLDVEEGYSDWISRIIAKEKAVLGELNYIFCNDTYLLNVNEQYLGHDTFTDIITFDYVEGNTISGDIFISIERVIENAAKYEVGFAVELQRVMSHGVLHLLGYNDKAEEEQTLMKSKENEMMELFHVEQ